MGHVTGGALATCIAPSWREDEYTMNDMAASALGLYPGKPAWGVRVWLEARSMAHCMHRTEHARLVPKVYELLVDMCACL